MSEVLPQYTGLTVNSVSYRYTTVKLASDPFVVTVQNYNAQSSGFIFRSVDDWTGLPGNTITKTIPTDNIPVNYWGLGEIRTQGIGTITNPYVSYSYKYDTCRLTPVTDTSCANYRPTIPDVKIPEPVYETVPIIQQSVLQDTEQNITKPQQSENPEKRAGNSAGSKTPNLLITAQAAAQAAALEALNNIPDFKLYSVALPGGVYQETIKYPSKVLPDSKNSQRLNLSQQRLHNTMVESQYNLRK